MGRFLGLLAGVAIVLSLPSGWSLPPAQDDAGSGQDAPDAPSAAFAIASGLVYSGQLTDGDQHDWYAFAASAGQIVEARVVGNDGCWEIAGADGVALAHRCGRASYVEGAPLLATVPSTGTWYFHYENVPLDVYRFSLGVGETAAAPLVGPAAPEVGGSAPQDDAGSGRDAPDTRDDSFLIATGVAHAARLGGIEDDEDDWFAFGLTAGDALELHVDGPIGCFEIFSPAGALLTSGCVDLGIPRTVQVTAATTGTYAFHYYYFVPQDYVFSTGVNAPAPPASVLPAPQQEQDDAGSGRDAPTSRRPDVAPAPGVVHQGRLTGQLGDEADWYAFNAAAGDVFRLGISAVVACVDLTDAAGTQLAFTCADASDPVLLPSTLQATLAGSGLHYIYVHYFVPQEYAFSFALNAVPPATSLPSQVGPVARVGDLVPPADAWRRASVSGEPLTVVLEDEPVRLLVRANGRILAPGVVVRDGEGAPVDLSGVDALAGTAMGEPGSWARVTLLGDEVVGHVSIPGRGAYTLATRDDGAAVALSDALLRKTLPRDARPFDLHDAPPLALDLGGVGGCLRATPQRVANPLGLALGWPARTFDVAFAVDDEFVQFHGPAWAARALTYVNTLDGLYSASMDLGLQVVDLHAHPAGGLPGSDTAGLLVSMGSHYGAGHAGLVRENAHLFSGKTLTGAAVGQANCIGGAGDPSIAYTVGVATDDDPTNFIGLGVRWFPDVSTKIAGHEMAHILSAHHHYASCVERQTQYDPIATLDACTLLINDIGLASLQISAVNKLVTRGWAEYADL